MVFKKDIQKSRKEFLKKIKDGSRIIVNKPTVKIKWNTKKYSLIPKEGRKI